MYNQELKEAFVRSYNKTTLSAKLANNTFRFLEELERKHNIDVSRLDKNLISEEFKKAAFDEKQMSKMLNLLCTYVQWCAAHQQPVNMDILNISIPIVEKMKVQMTASPLHLQTLLDSALETPAMETTDCVLRAFVWLVYAGIPANETIQITIDNVDLYKLMVHYKNNYYELYSESRDALEKACTLSEFQFIHPNYKTVKFRSDGDKLLRGIRGDLSKNVLENHLYKKFRAANVGLTMFSIYQSGIFYRLHEQERAGLPLNFVAIILKDFEERNYQPDSEMAYNRELRQRMGIIRFNYEMWKKAFNS